MSITDLLAEIQTLNAPYCDAESQSAKPGKSAGPVERLLCADGSTWIEAPEDIQEFYQFGSPWSLCSVEQVWLSAAEMPDLLKNPNISELLCSDFDKGLLLFEPAKKNNSVLFAYDYLPSIFQRAYFVFPEPRSYFVLDAGSEIVRYENIEAYLTFWRDVVAD